MKLNLVQEDSNSQLNIILVKDKKLKKNKELLKTLKFDGSDETSALLVESKKLYVGYESKNEDSLRIAASTAIREVNKTTFRSAQVSCNDNELREVIEGLYLGNYTFDIYKSKKNKDKEKTVNVMVEKITEDTLKIFADACDICESVNMVRTFVNTTPEDFNPITMAKESKKIAKNNGLEYKVFSDDYFKKKGMGSIAAVGRSSRHKSQLIHMTYKPKGEIKKKIVLVGKGLTYDSGGLSLKPADFMVTMKMDKSGGVAVMGLMDAIAKLNLPIEVHGIIGAVENMLGGDAYKPDDVLVAKNGKTIEVRNTDAEGRLVLADCLCYAQDEIKDIDHIMDFATLTGASVVGVGQYTTAIMGNNTKLNEKVVSAALASGELATTLPFNRYLRKKIKSGIADVCNVASTRYGGAITAGMFLDEFIEEENKDKWVHCDIAGPAYAEEAWGYNPYGGSGAGVRFTIEFLQSLLKD